jgi:hypothetical protein
MSTLAQFPDDPSLRAAYNTLWKSYGGYTDPKTGQVIPNQPSRLGADSNKDLNSNEWLNVTKGVEESLSDLNSDNEMLMLNVQTLMQQRNQISQFASNVLNTMNESVKAVIGNLRP